MHDHRIETRAELAKFINDWAKIGHQHDLSMTEADVERLDDERAVFTVRIPDDALSSIRFDLARPVIDRAVASLRSILAASAPDLLDLQALQDYAAISADEPETDPLDEN